MPLYPSDSTMLKLHYVYSQCVAWSACLFGRLYPSLRPYLVQNQTHLANKNVIVTGANSGIGLQMAKDLVNLGANVTLACRNQSKGQEAVDEILTLSPNARDRVHLGQLDTSSSSSVRSFVENYAEKTVDVLINNAGMGALPPGATSDFTSEGYELLYATNFLGSFLLTHLLESRLADDARVIFTSSTGQYAGKFGKDFSISSVKNNIEPGFGISDTTTASAMMKRYSMTKSMQCAFARMLQDKWDRDAKVTGSINKRTAHSFTPDYTSTAIFGKYEVKKFAQEPVWALLKLLTMIAVGVEEGAATGTWLASTNDSRVIGSGQGGHFWDRMTNLTSVADMTDRGVLDRLWIRWEADAGIEWR